MIFYPRTASLLFMRNIEKNSLVAFSVYIEKASPRLEQCIIKKYYFAILSMILASTVNFQESKNQIKN